VVSARLRYLMKGSNPKLIVLHGGPGIGYEYLEPELTKITANSPGVAFYDQRGSGLSTGAETPSFLNMPQYVADLESVRLSLECDRPILIGHSFGGLLALYYAIAHPGRVAGLLLLDPDPASRVLWSGYAQRARIRQSESSMREMAAIQATPTWTADPELIARYFELYLGPYFAKGVAPDGFGRRFTQVIPENLITTGSAVRASLGNWDIHASLRRIDCLCLIVVGEDSFFPPDSTRQLQAALINSSVVTLKEASHFPQIEAPGECEAALREFLARLVAC